MQTIDIFKKCPHQIPNREKFNEKKKAFNFSDFIFPRENPIQFPLKCRPVFLVHTLWTPICIVIQIFGSCLIFVMTDANSPTHTNKRNSL